MVRKLKSSGKPKRCSYLCKYKRHKVKYGLGTRTNSKTMKSKMKESTSENHTQNLGQVQGTNTNPTLTANQNHNHNHLESSLVTEPSVIPILGQQRHCHGQRKVQTRDQSHVPTNLRNDALRNLYKLINERWKMLRHLHTYQRHLNYLFETNVVEESSRSHTTPEDQDQNFEMHLASQKTTLDKQNQILYHQQNDLKESIELLEWPIKETEKYRKFENEEQFTDDSSKTSDDYEFEKQRKIAMLQEIIQYLNNTFSDQALSIRNAAPKSRLLGKSSGYDTSSSYSGLFPHLSVISAPVDAIKSALERDKILLRPIMQAQPAGSEKSVNANHQNRHHNHREWSLINEPLTNPMPGQQRHSHGHSKCPTRALRTLNNLFDQRRSMLSSLCAYRRHLNYLFETIVLEHSSRSHATPQDPGQDIDIRLASKKNDQQNQILEHQEDGIKESIELLEWLIKKIQKYRKFAIEAQLTGGSCKSSDDSQDDSESGQQREIATFQKIIRYLNDTFTNQTILTPNVDPQSRLLDKSSGYNTSSSYSGLFPHLSVMSAPVDEIKSALKQDKILFGRIMQIIHSDAGPVKQDYKDIEDKTKQQLAPVSVITLVQEETLLVRINPAWAVAEKVNCPYCHKLILIASVVRHIKHHHICRKSTGAIENARGEHMMWRERLV